MIENNRTNELRGQYELSDLLPRDEGTGLPEGYDAEGNLLNVDALPEEGGGRTEEAQTPADAGKVPYAKPEILSGPPQAPGADRLSALATEIKAITEQTRGVVISAALAVGKRLVEARSLCQEGRWLEWLETAVDYSERKAQDMMRLYEVYGRSGSMQPTFKTALTLLQEVAREDGHAADAFATALTNACKVLMNQLGSGE